MSSLRNKSSIEPEWYRFCKGVFTGTIAGASSTLAGHPLDTVKVRLQLQCSSNCIYNGFVDCIKKIYNGEGVMGFYKGVSSPLCGQIFMKSAMFLSYYEALYILENDNPKSTDQSFYKHIFAGAFSGAFCSFIDTPFEMVKSKLQVQIKPSTNSSQFAKTSAYSGVLNAGISIYKAHGIRGLYQGYAPLFIRNSIGSPLYFCCFEFCKHFFLFENQKIEDINSVQTMLSGFMSGIMFWSTIYNIDVVKSSIMTDHSDIAKRRFKGTWMCVKHLYVNEGGYSRFWRGFTPCIMRAGPANALTLFMADKSRQWFPSYSQIPNLFS